VPRGRENAERLTADVIELARCYGRYGYRKIAALLRQAGWSASDGRLEPAPPEYPNHVWSYDFIEDRTHEGRRFHMLNVIDEFSHECLAIRVARKADHNELGPVHVRPVSGFLSGRPMWLLRTIRLHDSWLSRLLRRSRSGPPTDTG
jgi:hypothetical protein